MKKDARENGQRNDTSALLKEQNRNSAERFIDSKWIAKQGDFLYVWIS